MARLFTSDEERLMFPTMKSLLTEAPLGSMSVIPSQGERTDTTDWGNLDKKTANYKEFVHMLDRSDVKSVYRDLFKAVPQTVDLVIFNAASDASVQLSKFIKANGHELVDYGGTDSDWISKPMSPAQAKPILDALGVSLNPANTTVLFAPFGEGDVEPLQFLSHDIGHAMIALQTHGPLSGKWDEKTYTAFGKFIVAIGGDELYRRSATGMMSLFYPNLAVGAFGEDSEPDFWSVYFARGTVAPEFDDFVGAFKNGIKIAELGSSLTADQFEMLLRDGLGLKAFPRKEQFEGASKALAAELDQYYAQQLKAVAGKVFFFTAG